MNSEHEALMQEAINLSIKGMENNEGGPFGAIVVKDGQIIGRGNNKVTSSNDPTAHAEVVAIRDACKNLGTFQLDGCIIYTSCEPCPMCLGAIYWARPDKVFYACTKEDAADAGFDDAFIYREIESEYTTRSIPFIQIARPAASLAFEQWKAKSDKTEY
jgi:guanine deaminase